MTVIQTDALPAAGLVALNVAAWGCIHAGTGWYVHRLALSRLDHDGWLWRARAWERDGCLYERLGIRSWKDRLPEAGDVFAGGMSKRRLPPSDTGGLDRFAAETRRAELGHWLAAAAGPLFVLWNPLPIAAVMVGYGLLVNLPFIVIQRYNRLRVARITARRRARADRRAGPKPPSEPQPGPG